MVINKVRLIAVSLGILIAVSSCGAKPGAPGASDVKKLAGAQITEYHGKKLSSIEDVKDVSIKGPQSIDIKTYKLKIDGLVQKPADFTYDEILSNTRYSKEVVLNCVEGWSADILWEGILLKDLFDKVTADSKANTVIFYAADGYTTSLPLKTILDKKMIIAYKMNGVVLPPQNGYPFILVAEDKLGYKWIKWITRIELSDNSDYKGYWESRGYSNEADVEN